MLNSQISISGIFSGFIFGVLGFYTFRKGKNEAEYDLIFIGITMMIYPYFTTGPWIDWLLGLSLCALAYYRPFRH